VTGPNSNHNPYPNPNLNPNRNPTPNPKVMFDFDLKNKETLNSFSLVNSAFYPSAVDKPASLVLAKARCAVYSLVSGDRLHCVAW